MKRPLFCMALAWMIGGVAADSLPFFTSISVGVAGLILFAVDGYRRNGHQRFSRWGLPFLCLVMVLAGYLRTAGVAWEYGGAVRDFRDLNLPPKTVLRGTLASAFEQHGKTWRGFVDPDSVWDGSRWRTFSGKAEVVIAATAPPEAEAGDGVTFTGTWKTPEEIRGAGSSDLRSWYENRGVVVRFLSFSLSDLRIRRVIFPQLRYRIVRWRDSWRNRIFRWINEHLEPPYSSLVSAMTTGNRGTLPDSLRRDLMDSGLYHLTAISGLHVTSLLLGFPWILKIFRIDRLKRTLFFGIPLAFLFLGLVGARVPVLRATVVGIALMMASCLDRPPQHLNLLGGAALLLLVVSPHQLRTPGFQLSFFIVLALILWGPGRTGGIAGKRVEDLVQRRWSPAVQPWRTLVFLSTVLHSALWASLVAVLAASPFTLLHFHRLTLNALVGNLIGVPLAVGVTFLGVMVCLCLVMIPPVAVVFTPLLQGLSHFLVHWTHWVASLPLNLGHLSDLRFPQIILVVSIVGILQLPRHWRPAPFLNRRIAALSLLVVLSWWPYLVSKREFRFFALDVGQGDALLMRFPRGETILVDTGPPSPGGNGNPSRLTRHLLDIGVHRVDGVVLTHPELDHYGGLESLIRGMPVGTILFNGDTNPAVSFRHLAETVESASIPVHRLLAGDRILGIRDATLTVLNPTARDLIYRLGTRNDRSVVLHVECTGGFRLLLTGDIGGSWEEKILRSSKDLLRAHLLKVAHHGSRFSSQPAFLRAVSPEIAVISCGENPYGHPHPETLRRLSRVGATIFTTQEEGTLRFVWDGKTLKIFSTKPRNAFY